MTTTNCAWWQRWWHHRLRQADIDLMWAMLKTKSHGLRAIRAWRQFISDTGQEHWRCPCSERDARTWQMKQIGTGAASSTGYDT